MTKKELLIKLGNKVIPINSENDITLTEYQSEGWGRIEKLYWQRVRRKLQNSKTIKKNDFKISILKTLRRL